MLGQTVVVIGGSAGIGLDTARRARARGRRHPHRPQSRPPPARRARTRCTAHRGLRRHGSGAARAVLPGPAQTDRPRDGHSRRSYYARLADLDFTKARRALDEHLWLTLHVARDAADKARPGGTLLFITGTGARHPGLGLGIASTLAAALPALTANLALELAPVRVNLIAADFVDTPLSASLLGDDLEKRRSQLRASLPIGRVVGPADVAALAVHVMTNTARATYDVDGGEQIVSGLE